MSKRICVIGGGISGLCTAYRLKLQGFSVVLYEKGAAVGGNIGTEERDGFLMELGPNSTLVSTELLELVDSLGLSDEIATAQPAAKKRYILRRGKLIALPMGLVNAVTSEFISGGAKLRLLKEPFIKSTSPENESVAGFFERRLGREIVDYAVDPFIAGVFAGDPEVLSIRSAFPKVYELEAGHGSLLKGALFKKRDNKPKPPKKLGRTISFRGGMQVLTDTLASKLGGEVFVNTEVTRIEKGDKFRVSTAGGAEEFDAVVISTPSRAAGGLISGFDEGLAAKLGAIYHPPISVVHTAFRKEDVSFDIDGFGFLVPKLEKRKVLGSLWPSSIFEGRAPAGSHLFTTFVGGSRDAALVSGGHDPVELVLSELLDILGIRGNPLFTRVKTWDRSIPQYNIGHEKTVAAIEEFKARNPGIFFCSNFYRGISVADCVKSSVAATDEVSGYLR